ncbi:MAG: hypothetical protein JNM17_23360 [Archangium sp.]|nr:hypothetical protein [Archangium sp.]
MRPDRRGAGLREHVFFTAIALLSACAPEVPIGEERRLAIRTAIATPTGWREAGDRSAPAPLTGWYGRADANGAVPKITSLEVTPSAVLGSTMLGTTWVIAGSLGDRAFVRALDENDATLWETQLGTTGTIARGISTTNEGSLVVAGTEQRGATVQGWVALLEASGAIRWERHFDTDFQTTAIGFVPEAIVADPGAPSPTRRQFWVTGQRARPIGDHPAYAVQMTFDGELWDSDPFAEGGTARGVAAFNLGLAICIANDGAVQLAWTQGGAVSGAALTDVRLDDRFELAGCFSGTDEVELFGTLERGADRIPAVVTVDRATRALRGVREHPTARRASVFGGARATDGSLTAFGQQLEPVRRWRGVMP